MWRTFDDADHAADLAGRAAVTAEAGVPAVDLRGTDGSLLTIDLSVPGRLVRGDEAGAAHTIAVRPGVLLVGHRPSDDPDRDVTWLLDFPRRRALAVDVVSRPPDANGPRRVDVDVVTRGLAGHPPPEWPMTGALAGYRIRYDYGPDHVYEHVYLTASRLVWHDVLEGRADIEDAAVLAIDDDLYLIHWVETANARTATMVLDLAAGRLHGCVFGWQPGEQTNRHATVGARAHVENVTDHSAFGRRSGTEPGLRTSRP